MLIGRKAKQAVESEPSSESEGDDDLLPGAKPHIPGTSDASEDEADADEDLDGFIEEDHNAPVELPAEYSMNTYQDLMHHFKIICQLFVHLAVQPPGKRQAFMEKQKKGTRDLINSSCHKIYAERIIQYRPIFLCASPNYPTQNHGNAGFARDFFGVEDRI